MPSFASAFRHRSNSAPPLSQFGSHAVADPTMADREDRPERTGRRRPFSSLMKKLKNMKPGDAVRHASKRNNLKKQADNNPYAAVGRSNSDHVQIALTPPPTSHYSVSSTRSQRTSSTTSIEPSDDSVRLSTEGHPPPTMGGRSTIAPTVVTDHETSCSMAAPSYGASSVTGTTRTANIDSRRGNDSTFSSPAPSVRSLTTTLTTIQSFVPNGAAATHNNNNSIQNSTNTSNSPNHHHHNHHSHHSSSQIIHFNQPFPTSNTPVSAIPAHLAPSGQGGNSPFYPTTYHTATANNLLTDNASILTLASSSKRRRRRSFDTDASVRALAPSSLFGGSRESLPLSVLSSNMEGTSGGMTGATTPGGLYRGPNALANDRTSIYSSTTGILASDRNSFYAKQAISGTGAGDAASVRSGLLGHGRAESINGSIGGGLNAAPMNGVASAGSLVGLSAAASPSPLASPRDRDRERRISGGVGNVDEDVEGEERA